MAKQTINVGSTANDGTGDALRIAGGKINDNFTELYTGKLDASAVDTDSTMGADSDSKIPSQKATKAAIEAAVSALVNASPSTLDTLKELADALGDDANFAATMTAALAGKINISDIDTDSSFAANSDTKVPSQKAVKAAIAAVVVGGGGREILSADRTYYVRTDGNDSNDGLTNTSGGAFLTVQKAIDVVSGAIDTSQYNVIIQIGDGTYASSSPLTLKDYVGGGTVILQGNLTTPTNVVLDVTASSGVEAIRIRSGWKLSSFQIKNNTSGAILLNVQATAITCENVCYNANSTGQFHIFGIMGAAISYSGSLIQVAGGGISHIFLDGGAQFYQASTAVTTISGTPAFSLAFAYANLASGLRAGPATYSGSTTGKRYQAQLGGVIDVSGSGANYFPGSSAGTTATGGQYA